MKKKPLCLSCAVFAIYVICIYEIFYAYIKYFALFSFDFWKRGNMFSLCSHLLCDKLQLAYLLTLFKNLTL